MRHLGRSNVCRSFGVGYITMSLTAAMSPPSRVLRIETAESRYRSFRKHRTRPTSMNPSARWAAALTSLSGCAPDANSLQPCERPHSSAATISARPTPLRRAFGTTNHPSRYAHGCSRSPRRTRESIARRVRPGTRRHPQRGGLRAAPAGRPQRSGRCLHGARLRSPRAKGCGAAGATRQRPAVGRVEQ